MRSEAILINEHGGPEVLRLEKVVVRAPEADEVTLDQKAVGLNYIDIYFRTGLYSHPLPHGLGFEAAGVVTAVGANVKHLQVGDRVAYAQSPLGAYASSRTLPAQHVVKIPDALRFDEAAAIMLKGLTVQYLFRQTYRLRAGETIVFHAAAGGVGLIACQWARALGVQLIGTASSPEKAALARAHGAWEVIDYTRENVPARVDELTDGKKVPVVYDGVGKTTWLDSLSCLQSRGLMVSFGNASGAVEGVSLSDLTTRGSLFVTRPTMTDYIDSTQEVVQASAELFELLASNQIKVTIGQRFALSEAGRAHEALASRQTTGATVFIPDS